MTVVDLEDRYRALPDQSLVVICWPSREGRNIAGARVMQLDHVTGCVRGDTYLGTCREDHYVERTYTEPIMADCWMAPVTEDQVARWQMLQAMGERDLVERELVSLKETTDAQET